MKGGVGRSRGMGLLLALWVAGVASTCGSRTTGGAAAPGTPNGFGRASGAASEAGRVESRVALVVGNGAYGSSALRNAVADAEAVAGVLGRVGFEVVLLKKDVDRTTFLAALRDFEARLRTDGVGLFYYAGHAIEVEGNNYLLPIGSIERMPTDNNVDDEAIPLDRVLRALQSRRVRAGLVFLDACRNNPLTPSARSAPRGLAVTKPVSGVLIAYATQPGGVAEDGDGEHGRFTGALLSQIERPGLSLQDVLYEVRRDVQVQTAGVQVPWETNSLFEPFYFVRAAPPRTVCPKGTVFVAGACHPPVVCPAGMDFDWASRQCVPDDESSRDAGVASSRNSPGVPVPPAPVQEIAPVSPPASSLDDVRSNARGSEMVRVPAGPFQMGTTARQQEAVCEQHVAGGFDCPDDAFADERPARAVDVPEFWIDRHEVTLADYKACVDAGGCRPPVPGAGNLKADCLWGKREEPSLPLNCVTWNEADAYCTWAGKRLPSEAEWEKAARGTDGRLYPWGDEVPSCELAVWKSGKGISSRGCDRNKPWPVCSKPAGNSPYGVCDMAGSVWEFTRDRASPSGQVRPEPRRAAKVRAVPVEYVMRGGSWYCGRPYRLHAANRYALPADDREPNVGFRCVSSIPPR